jgi:hypothetical protein
MIALQDDAPTACLPREKAKSGDPVEILPAATLMITGSSTHPEAAKNRGTMEPHDALVNDPPGRYVAFLRQRCCPNRSTGVEATMGEKVPHRWLVVGQGEKIYRHERASEKIGDVISSGPSSWCIRRIDSRPSWMAWEAEPRVMKHLGIVG